MFSHCNRLQLVYPLARFHVTCVHYLLKPIKLTSPTHPSCSPPPSPASCLIYLAGPSQNGFKSGPQKTSLCTCDSGLYKSQTGSILCLTLLVICIYFIFMPESSIVGAESLLTAQVSLFTIDPSVLGLGRQSCSSLKEWVCGGEGEGAGGFSGVFFRFCHF